jgi:hypothetical protein
MKVVVRLEKAGEVLAQHELEVHNPDKFEKRAATAFKRLRQDHPELSLFGEGIYVKFDKVD